MNTKTVTLAGWLVYDHFKAKRPISFPDGPFGWCPWKPSDDSETVVLREQAITIEVPTDFDPRPQQVRALEAQKRALQAKFAERCTEIERQINELTAIECSGVTE